MKRKVVPIPLAPDYLLAEQNFTLPFTKIKQ